MSDSVTTTLIQRGYLEWWVVVWRGSWLLLLLSRKLHPNVGGKGATSGSLVDGLCFTSQGQWPFNSFNSGSGCCDLINWKTAVL